MALIESRRKFANDDNREVRRCAIQEEPRLSAEPKETLVTTVIVGQIPTRNEIESMIWDMECFDVYRQSIAEIEKKSPGLFEQAAGEA
jgi:hypothetical protein